LLLSSGFVRMGTVTLIQKANQDTSFIGVRHLITNRHMVSDTEKGAGFIFDNWGQTPIPAHN
jgi:hypothetical protein